MVVSENDNVKMWTALESPAETHTIGKITGYAAPVTDVFHSMHILKGAAMLRVSAFAIGARAGYQKMATP
jgi:hypothetical protein